MRKFLSLLAALLCTSCITVDDPGPFWEKAGVDPTIPGKWSIVASNASNEGVDRIHIYGKDKNLNIDLYKGGKKLNRDNNPSDQQHSQYRTLAAGPYHFLLIKYEDSSMVMFRYEIKGDLLTVYTDQAGYIDYFFKQNFPQSPDIAVRSYGIGNALSHKYIEIYSLNDTTLGMLAKIPDDPAYWQNNSTYERIR